MKKYLAILGLALLGLCAGAALAQVAQESVSVQNSVPTGACSIAPLVKVSNIGTYQCVGGVWTLVGPNGDGGSVESVFGRTGVVAAQTGDYSAAQISGLGTAATANLGTSGSTIPLLSLSNTWVGAQYFSTGVATNLINNTAAGNNASIGLTTTGATISRNVADANAAATIIQTNASSTGNIANFSNNTGVVASISQAGVINGSSVSVGASAPAACGAATGCWAFTEAATTGTPTVNQCYIRADSTTNKFLISCNHSAEAPIVTAVAPQVTLIGGAQTGTYTTPAGAVALRVWAVGCGGGGGGSGTSAGNGGNCGSTNTTFGSSIVAGFGAGSAAFYAQGGNGGSAAGGTDLHAGNPGANVGLGIITDNGGAGGGAGCGGGAGAGGLAQGSGTQAAGQGGQSPGGGGGGAAADGVPNAGAGGGGGGCVYMLIASPLATYAYATGGTAPGGVAGTSGFAGGDGAAGQIMVEALFQ